MDIYFHLYLNMCLQEHHAIVHTLSWAYCEILMRCAGYVCSQNSIRICLPPPRGNSHASHVPLLFILLEARVMCVSHLVREFRAFQQTSEIQFYSVFLFFLLCLFSLTVFVPSFLSFLFLPSSPSSLLFLLQSFFTSDFRASLNVKML
jgi:hypothetical protein